MSKLTRFAVKRWVAISVTILTVSCASPPTDKEITAATKGMASRQDLEVVDCLLPGQVRQLGNSTYLTPRRPVKTTSSDCRIRGGEYVAFDRANLKTALNVWMTSAEAGDAEAQNYVGEIFERGLGEQANYQAAIIWYQKAADQGFARAQFNLGTLYEQGLGVPADKLKALNLYRQSWGLPEDSVMYQSAAAQEQSSLRAELQKQITEKDEQLKLLQPQLRQVQELLAKQTAPANAVKPDASKVDALNRQVDSLKRWIAALEAERSQGAERVASIAILRTPSVTATSALPNKQVTLAQVQSAGGMNFGRYYALVIGNQHYKSMDSLQTPLSDVTWAAKVLADKYGFNVQILEDANDVTMLKALNDLNGILKPDDNVLIYYAGHGSRLQSAKNEVGYWLPVNADAPPQDTYWVPNEQVTAHLGRLPAKRVLVVADSCYAGLLSADPSYLFVSDKVGYSLDYIKYKLPKRSRLLLASGGDEPVLDIGGGKNSVFARAFLEELESNSGVLPAPELFARINKRVSAAAANNKVVQKPELKTIKGAGHELGDFFFVPRS
jgi:uncharacterized protein